VFAEIGGRTALDDFSGSGVVSYLLKCLGYQVTANHFPQLPVDHRRRHGSEPDGTAASTDIETICGPAADDRDFIRRTFDGPYFTPDDRRFLDSAWSNIDTLTGGKRALAVSALVLALVRKQRNCEDC
jgi:adenine-specific DNA-methyltransferase